MTNLINNGLLDEYSNNQPYKAIWNKLNCDKPKRSGHQMVLDLNNEILYLFGGWDGRQDLADLWSFDIKLNKCNSTELTLISNDTYSVGGPPLIFDHQLSIDHDKRMIYGFGGRILLSSSSLPLSTPTNTNTLSSSSTTTTTTTLFWLIFISYTNKYLLVYDMNISQKRVVVVVVVDDDDNVLVFVGVDNGKDDDESKILPPNP
ncbi:hypothetical protein HCN44_000411 [Aphidius gifuensis]|uniref:Uncharacterized protein n=1 Tax=Aphidius gifuensis TaxID=684658 RepID=A0A834XQY7_APHGI|nr:hypothetical protein HCN44_000411 [Aphidius gifuensis]